MGDLSISQLLGRSVLFQLPGVVDLVIRPLNVGRQAVVIFTSVRLEKPVDY